MFEDHSIKVGYTIKYLHPYARFRILGNDLPNLTSEPPPTKPIKPTSNPQITREFAGITKDSAKHKVWRAKKARPGFSKARAGTSAYITTSDKKTDDDTDWTTIEDPEGVTSQAYFITDIMGSIINAGEVWLIEGLNDRYKRGTHAKDMANRHTLWKIQAHKLYKKQCQDSIKHRIQWECDLLQQASRYHLRVYWPTNLSIDEVMKLASPKGKYLMDLLFEIDPRELIEQEDTLSDKEKDEDVNPFLLEGGDLSR